jgi:pyruvate formate lyase activating enzyme
MAKELPVVPRYVLNRYKVPEKYMPEEEKRVLEKAYSREEIQSFAETLTPWQPNIMF